jgi:hypothetical protein
MTADQPPLSPIFVEDETLRQGFTQIPNAILRLRELSPGAKLAYMVLLSYAWQKESCFPGQETLAEDMGVTSRSVITYLKQLQEAGLLIVKRRGLGQTNLYVLPRFNARSENFSVQDVKESAAPEVKIFHPEEDSLKKTQQEKPVEDSNARLVNKAKKYDEDREMIFPYVEDFAREMNDQASLTASTTRAVNLYRRSGLTREAFIDYLYQARQITKERTAGIHQPAENGRSPYPKKQKMAYLFAVLEDLVDRKEV